MNRKYKTDIPLKFLDKLNGYTGAEIEQLANDSLFDGFDEAFNNLVPLSRSMREEINSLREWSKTRARIANTLDEGPQKQRKIRALKSRERRKAFDTKTVY